MRNIINKTIVYILHYSGFNFICSLFFSRKIFVLNYHSIRDQKNNKFSWMYPNLSVDVRDFERQIKYLKRRGHTFFKILDLNGEEAHNANKPTAIYFDDGFKDNLIYALPILQKYKIPATIFISTNLIDRKNFLWTLKHRYFLKELGRGRRDIEKEIIRMKTLTSDERDKMLNKIYKENNFSFNPGDFDIFLNWNDVKVLSAHDVEIGSHGITHRALTEYSYKDAEQEIADSKKAIEDKIQKSVRSFSYPYGRWNNDTNKIVAESGYNFIVSAGEGLNTLKDIRKKPAFLRNIPVRPGKSLVDFKVRIYARNIIKAIW